MSDKVQKILIVDDEEDITIAISEYLKRQEKSISPIVTNDPRLVFPLLAEHEDIRLILSDFRMPAINGLDLLLRVKAQYPNILFIIMTGYGTPELEKEGIRRGAIRYVEKPFDISELVMTLKDALSSSTGGFGGVIQEVQLPDIIQLIGMSGRTVALNITADQGRGTMFFQDGEIVHAICGDLSGEEAFFEIFDWSGGQFGLASRSPGSEKTIFGTWQGLLLEAARRLDEAKAPVQDGEIESKEKEEGATLVEDSITLESELELDDDLISMDDISFGEDEEVHKDGLAEFATIEEVENGSVLNNIDETSPIDSGIKSESKDNGSQEFDLFPNVVDREITIPPGAASNGITVLTIKLISEALDLAVERYLSFWPKKKEKISYNKLPLEKLGTRLRTLILYRFQMITTSVVRTDNTPFNFVDKNVQKALKQLFETLRDTWMISRDMYKNLLFESIRFELAYAVDPARAIAQFLQIHAEGHVNRIHALVHGMIERELIDPDFEQLVEEFERQGDPRVHPRKVENFIRTILDRRKEEEGFDAMRSAIDRVVRIVSDGSGQEPVQIHLNVIISLLESRGLEQISEFVKVERRVGKKTISFEDLDAMKERYRFYRKNRE